MKRTLKKMLILAMCTIMSVSSLAVSSSAVDVDPTIRVGLYYGTAALPAANLENASGLGSGYRFGYFNANYEFIQAGYTQATSIAVLKDSNMYGSLGSDYMYNYYDTPIAGSGATVGAYHIQLNAVYYSFEEASAACVYDGAFPAYINGEFRVRVGSYLSYAEAEAQAVARQFMPGAYSVVGGSTTGYTVVDRQTSRILFEFDYNGVTAFGIMPDVTGAYDVQTWFKGYKYRGGFEYKRLNGNDITVINYVSIHNYVKGILPYEMSSSWPIEALKAQALAAKSYTLCSLNKHSSSGFDLCNTTDCQVYRGTNDANANSDAAVDATYGEYVLYNGVPAECFYYSSSGGASEDAKNIWNEDVPYLKGVNDAAYDKNDTYSHTFSCGDLAWLLQAKGYSCSGSIVQCYVSATTEMGNVYSVTMVDSAGKTMTFSKESARNIFYSETLGNTQTSQRFEVITNYSDGSTSGGGRSAVYVNGIDSGISDFSEVYAIGSSGTALLGSETYAVSSGGTSVVRGSGGSGSGTAVSFTVTGAGYGHNVGMSQWGAYNMATSGMNYRQILQYYYTGVVIGR